MIEAIEINLETCIFARILITDNLKLNFMFIFNNHSVNCIFAQAVDYNKLADDTSLHIKYTAVTAIHFSSSTDYYFGRW